MIQSKSIENSVILITGGTGSFGSTLTKVLLKQNIKEVRIFSRDENKQYFMRKKLNDPRVSFYIGDVRDFQSTSDACRNVDYIFQLHFLLFANPIIFISKLLAFPKKIFSSMRTNIRFGCVSTS